eukprot:PhM_4_TR12401/c1_g1_i1/m.98541/K19952/RABIF, MSS4, DSS4; guanine nucleotide exchange factor
MSKNTSPLKCLSCGLVLVSPGVATIVNDRTHTLQLSADGTVKGTYHDWWVLPNYPAFDNITASRLDDRGMRFFSCADCEVEIIGFSETKTSPECFVACDLVDSARIEE